MDVEINWLAVIVAGLAQVVLGFIWYSSSVFGKAWLREVGLSDEAAREGFSAGMLIWTFLGAFATSLVLAIVIGWSGAEDALEGLLVGLVVGLGFFLVSNSVRDMYEQRSTKLSLITSGNDVVAMALSGVILGAWM